ncbi:unnamed protein product, partial [Polarella glacialis]
VFIIKTLGLGPGLITWGTVALIIGWLTGFFGLFGIPSEQDQLQTPWLNVLGFVLSLCALVDSAFVTKTPAAADLSLEKLAVLPLVSSEAQAMLETYGENESERESADARVCENARKMAETGRRASGMLVAVVAGCFFGVSFLPSTWIMHHIAGASQDGLDYVFNQFCGILLASVFYFLAYCAYKNNRPAVNPEIILPGFVSGVMWAIGQACVFVAISELGYSAAFPIIAIGPGFVGSMWSVCLFKDISGWRNYVFLAAYFCIATVACGCIVASRKQQ